LPVHTRRRAGAVARRMLDSLLPLLRCARCGGGLAASGAGAPPAFTCTRCGTVVPIVDGIPRFVTVPDEDAARRTQASFGYEWTHFNDWRPSGETNFNDYFDGVNLASLQGSVVLDAGCGMGR